MKLDPQVTRVLAEIATVQSVVESYQRNRHLPDLENACGIVKYSDELEEVRRYHLEYTILRGQDAALDAISLGAAMPGHSQTKTLLYVMSQRLEVALDELHSIKDQ